MKVEATAREKNTCLVESTHHLQRRAFQTPAHPKPLTKPGILISFIILLNGNNRYAGQKEGTNIIGTTIIVKQINKN